MAQFCLFAAHELPSRGSIEEQVAHRNGRTFRQSSVFHAEQLTSGDLHDRTGLVLGGSSLQTHTCDGCD